MADQAIPGKEWGGKPIPRGCSSGQIRHQDLRRGHARSGDGSHRCVSRNDDPGRLPGQIHPVIDTSGIPDTEYKIQGAGDVRPSGSEAHLRVAAVTTKSLPDPMPQPKIRSVQITPQVIVWYADQINLDPQNRTQYSEAEDPSRKGSERDTGRS